MEISLKKGQISALIRDVHKELVDSQNDRESNGLDPFFAFDSFDLEINFATTESTGVEGGLGIKIISAKGNEKYTSEQVHKLTIRMKRTDFEENQSIAIPAGALPSKMK